jgi:hypothetical protein
MGKVYRFDVPYFEIRTYRKLELFKEAMEYCKWFSETYSNWCSTEEAEELIMRCNRVFGTNYNISNAAKAIHFLKFIMIKYESGEFKPAIKIK